LISFASGVCAADPLRMEEVAGRLGLDLTGFRAQPFVKLSGGQKQKVLISIALGRPTELLVMDEPAANLDPEARRTFFELLAEREGTAAMLISSHRLDEVAALVNRVIELDRGAVVLDDRVADLVDLASRLSCRLMLTRADDAFAHAVRAWGFRTPDNGHSWEGVVAGADRLRFLGMLSRYAALLASVALDEVRGPPPVEVGCA
jgi:ABC-2 type transport system ATP-binding protein